MSLNFRNGFVVWKEVKGGQGDFESFYRAQVEKIISQYKGKLPPP